MHGRRRVASPAPSSLCGMTGGRLITWEFARLCRGGSRSLTFPAIAPPTPTDETSNASCQAHERNRWTGVRAPEPTDDGRRIPRGIDRRRMLNLRCDTRRYGPQWGATAAFRQLTYRGRAATPMPL